jgi:hypothetical protein
VLLWFALCRSLKMEIKWSHDVKLLCGKFDVLRSQLALRCIMSRTVPYCSTYCQCSTGPDAVMHFTIGRHLYPHTGATAYRPTVSGYLHVTAKEDLSINSVNIGYSTAETNNSVDAKRAYFTPVLKRSNPVLFNVLNYTNSARSRVLNSGLNTRRRYVNPLLTYLLHGAESFLRS